MKHRATAALLVASSLLAGCTKQGLKIGVVGLVAVGVGGSLGAPTLDGDGPSTSTATYAVGAGLLFVGTLLLPYGIIFGIHDWFKERHDEEERVARDQAERQVASERAQRMVTRERAWRLTQTAAAAARAGDCATVKALDTRVAELEFGFHDVVFARDVAISACLAPRAP
ncbi:MAG: hypothetical protein JWO36_4594 [Myxococcales bacterium]|nr:hypothetical protein [Myxococcales bacterium]